MTAVTIYRYDRLLSGDRHGTDLQRSLSLAYADGELATIQYRTVDPGPMVEARPARDPDGDGSFEEGDGVSGTPMDVFAFLGDLLFGR